MLVPKKSLGQNFLRDENIVRKIAASLVATPSDLIVEIGPGPGALTRTLVYSGATVVGIEVDPRAVGLLRESFGTALEIIPEDVLKVDLKALSRARNRKLRVVGNIPYYATSDILFWLFDSSEVLVDATLMLQLEVAQRLTARVRTKAYGILSVFTEFYSVPELLFRVSRNSFFPVPGVDSAVVRLRFREALPACHRELFINVVRSTFGKRRKTLRNGLRYMGLPEDQIQSVRFDLTRRPEELSLDEFLVLTSALETAGVVAPAAPQETS